MVIVGIDDGVDEGDWLGATLGREDGCAEMDGCAEGAEVGHVPGAVATFTMFDDEVHPVPSSSPGFSYP